MSSYGPSILIGFLSLLGLALGVPLFLKKVPPNFWYGYRVSAYAMKDREIWYAVNCKGGKHLIMGSCALALLFIVSLFFVGDPAAQKTLMNITMFFTLAGVIYSAVVTVRLSMKMAREKGLR